VTLQTRINEIKKNIIRHKQFNCSPKAFVMLIFFIYVKLTIMKLLCNVNQYRSSVVSNKSDSIYTVFEGRADIFII